MPLALSILAVVISLIGMFYRQPQWGDESRPFHVVYPTTPRIDIPKDALTNQKCLENGITVYLNKDGTVDSIVCGSARLTYQTTEIH